MLMREGLVTIAKRYRTRRRTPTDQALRLAVADLDAGADWRVSAPCAQADPDAFFPVEERSDTEDAEYAKRICAGCSVRDACLTYAITADERWGIWGGLTTKERDDLVAARKTRRAA
jgi:WhiB family redox-sensing transcriptional regulator